jgi:NADH:ubiquinone oxidoreductase subunit 6 (subunit J)
MGAFFAAVLELTVGAGLTAVLFLVAITLTQGQEEMPVKERSAPTTSAAQGPEEVRPKREAAP